MKIWTRFGMTIAAPILLWSGVALGQSANPPAHQGATPGRWRVTSSRSMGPGRVTIRAADGTVHEFEASKETLQDLKEGDRIEARLRQP